MLNSFYKTHSVRTFWASSALLISFFAVTSNSQAQDISTSSLNNQISVVPAPTAVVIDGKDKDWDLSAGIWSYNDPTLVEKYSVWTHMMWDEKGIYYLARYHDPTPLRNATQGKDFA